MTRITRRQALLGAAALAAPATAHAADETTLRLSNYKAGDNLLMRLAGVNDTPYRIAWSEFGSGNLMLEAINAGALDLANGSEIPPVFAAVSGARANVVAVIKDDVNQQVVLVPKGSAITTVAGLKGKRVGYVRATTTHYYLLQMLAEVGLSFADITPVNLTPSDGQVAFTSGALDAWAIYGYSVPLAVQQGARVLRTARGILSGNYLYYANPDALADPARRNAIGEHLRRMARAYRWIDAHHAEYAAAQSAVLGVPAPILQALLDDASQPRRMAAPDQAAIASEQAVADTFARVGLLPRKVDVSTAWDFTFADQLRKEAAS